jgi:hypothetical protein
VFQIHLLHQFSLES